LTARQASRNGRAARCRPTGDLHIAQIKELDLLTEPALHGDGNAAHHPAALLLNDVQTLVFGVIGGDATPIDRIVAETGLSIAQALATLSVLTIQHIIRRLSGTTLAQG